MENNFREFSKRFDKAYSGWSSAGALSELPVAHRSINLPDFTTIALKINKPDMSPESGSNKPA